MKTLKSYFNRSVAAHSLICVGIITIGLGISIVHLGLGIASSGAACAIYGYILGAE